MTNLKRITLIAVSIIMVLTVFSSAMIPFGVATTNEDGGTPLVTLETTWKYLDNGTDPAGTGARTSWTAVDFDDSGWKTSPANTDAIFGAKAGALTALDSAGKYLPKILLNHYQSDNTCVPTYFFRATFNLDTLPEDGLSLLGTIVYDDAAIVYINGTRVAAYHEPDGGFESNLSYGGSGAYDPITVDFVADVNLLKTGKNVVSVEVHNQRADSSDIYFSMPSLKIGLGTPEYLSMNVGADETQRNFTWYFGSESGAVEYAIRSGDKFPTTYTSIKSTTTAHGDTYIHRATITNLKPDTEYVYRIKCGNAYSKNYYFETDKTDSFNFIFVGDPQIGGSWGGQDDVSEWGKTLDKAEAMFPNTSFMISAGDQVETYSNEEHYRGFLAPEALKSLAIATTVGNHDTEGVLYSQHFNNPNTTINGFEYGVTNAGGDYWYRYNNALFIHLNYNNLSVSEHKAFMKYAIAQNPDVTWKVVTLHFAMFGAGSYYNAQVIVDRRNAIAPVFDELDIDVVLAGHEHAYARAYMINDGFTPDTSKGVQSSVTDPEGVFYMTGSSSSGSKFYDMMTDAETPHIAVKVGHTTTFSNVEVDGDSFKVTTYNAKTGAVLDSFEIIKKDNLTPSLPDKSAENLLMWKPYDAPKSDRWNCNLADGAFVESMTWHNGDWYSLEYGANTDGTASITFDLGQPENIGTVRMHILNGGTSAEAGVVTAQKIEAFVSDDGTNFRSIGNMSIDQPTEATFQTYWSKLVLDQGVEARYLQIRVSHGWGHVMINEIEAYSAKHSHIAESKWYGDENGHWQECACGENMNADKHTAGDWVEAEDGTSTKSCTVCNYVLETRDGAVLGDVNKSGAIDMMDYILLKRNYFGTFKFDDEQLKLGDVNKSNAIDMMDYILLKRAYFGTFKLS